MESYSRVRSVKLKRVSGDEPFGFSVRGGHEHGTGIFVSFVDPRSVAYRQGLKVGDQILRVNGFPVSAAVHHECLSLMKIRTSLHLKVRSVGMLPVKEKTGDPLTWKLVEEQPSELPEGDFVDHGSESSSESVEAKIAIDLTGQSGLGCCICKGPPERPGIFVQSTKCNGAARESGLRPGDQVLSCNGHSFLHIQFAEAVYYLKSSKILQLRVLKGAASDLFPGESSGYNSSASSLNGETSQNGNGSGESSSHHGHNHGHSHNGHNGHHASDAHVEKRLSMVTEEGQNERSVALDRSIEWDEVEQVWHKAEKETLVIEVKGEDPTVQRLRSEESRLVEERRKLEQTQQFLREEAQRLEEEKRKFEEEKRRGEQARTVSVSPVAFCPPSSSSQGDGSNSGATSGGNSVSGGNSLAGALTQEILKRNERRESNGLTDERPKPGTVEQKRSLFNTHIDHEKRQQHEQLIEEFKRAHRKMFAHTAEQDNANANLGIKHTPSTAEQSVIKSRRVQKELDHERQMVAQRVAGIVRQRQLRIERQYQECAETEREVTTKLTKGPAPPPPPPPPFPTEGGKPALKPSLAMTSALAPKPVIIEEKSETQNHPVPTPSLRPSTKAPAPPPPSEKKRPESPSPDYSATPSPVASPPRPQRKPLGVDMQSLESFRLKDPPRSPKKPPPVYFHHQLLQNGNAGQMLTAYNNVPVGTTRLDMLRDGVENGDWMEAAGNMKPILKMGQSATNHTPKTISFGGRY